MPSYVLGIDLGTSSLKGIVYDRNGNIHGQASRDYPLLHPQVGYSEQNAEEWIRACREVFIELGNSIDGFADHLAGLSVSGQMHGLVTLDEHYALVRPAILWNDTRTTEQCRRIQADLGKTLIAETKNQALEGFTLPKILWLQEQELASWQKVRHIMLPKDYLVFWLTGKLATDYSDAAGTLLLDVKNRCWSQVILGQYNIPASYMPPLYHSTDEVGHVRAEIRAEFGFKENVRVMAGGADNACAAVGAGILQDGVGMVSIGTSGVFLSYEKEEHDYYNGQLHLFNHGVPKAYYSMGVTLSAGHSLNWYKQTFASEQSFEALLEGIESIPIGSAGLFFTPYIVGERTPYADSQIRGSFTGIDTVHTQKHFTRSVLEGITYSLKDSQRLMTEVAGKQFTQIISVGGGSKNATWLQMQADIFDAQIVCPTIEQGPAQGAAMMASVGLGWFDSLADAAKVFVQYKAPIYPIAENVAKYAEYYETYRRIYPALKQI